MNHQTAVEILRLGRLVQRARGYGDRGRESRNTSRIARAARLETAADAKLTAVTMAEASAYSDCD